MNILNTLLGILLVIGGFVILVKYGNYRAKNQLGGLTFKYLTFCFGLIAIGIYLIASEIAKIF